jgi:hypothetical protein
MGIAELEPHQSPLWNILISNHNPDSKVLTWGFKASLKIGEALNV